MNQPTIISHDSPIVLYSHQDLFLTVTRMHNARQTHRKSAADFEQEKRRQLGIKPLPKRKSIIRQVRELVKF